MPYSSDTLNSVTILGVNHCSSLHLLVLVGGIGNMLVGKLHESQLEQNYCNQWDLCQCSLWQWSSTSSISQRKQGIGMDAAARVCCTLPEMVMHRLLAIGECSGGSWRLLCTLPYFRVKRGRGDRISSSSTSSSYHLRQKILHNLHTLNDSGLICN